MNTDELIELVPPDVTDPRIQAAVAELQSLVATKFPLATFGTPYVDDSDGVSFVAIVDTDDLDDVVEAAMPRMLDMLVEEGLPVYVVPDWPTWRVREQVQAAKMASAYQPRLDVASA
ncbi:MAG: hypothetical protein ACR2LS_09010 [Thermomicrobiales bacterium]